MKMAEEEERRGSSGATLFSSYSTMRPTASAALEPPREPAAAEAVYSDDDMAGIDLGAYAGNFEPHFQYGGNPAELASGHVNRSGSQSQTLSSSGSQRKSGETSDADAYDPIHPFPPFSSNARVDTFGTGGFAEPGAHRRRLSYDEGDESSLMLSETSTAVEPPEMFYHPGMSQSRPLPPPPAGEQQFNQQQGPYGYQPGRGPYPTGPDQMVTPGGTLVPRSTSLVSHSNTPQTVPPIRSKTDAEERRLRSQGLRTSAIFEKDSSSDNLTPPTASTMTLDLPALPAGKRFNPSKLTPKDFAKCTEPWALSSIIAWLRMMAEGETDLKEHLIVEGLVNLFTYKVPTMNVADAEALSAQVVEEMYSAGTLEHVEEWLKFTPATRSGVLFQLSKAGCYAPMLHDYHAPGRCYSYHCQRTLKKIDLHAQPSVKRTEDWASFYKLKKEEVADVNKKEIERQNILHEIVQTEDNFMDNLNVLRHLYRDGLMQMQPPVIPPKKLKSFVRDVFGKVDGVKQSNEEHLLPQMKYRQQEQGPWVIGFSDIFREWIRKARGAYIDYAAAFPYATFLVRQEAERNILFRSFLDQARANKMSNKLAWDNFLKSPITRLQHYGLLLGTVLKRSLVDNEEKKNLMIAIEEIKAVTLECDARVAEMSRKVDLTDLQSKLILRPGMQRVELNLNHLGRELIFKGDLQRLGGTRFTWLETHALLFDHYLVLAKTVHHRDVEGGAKQERYDVSRLPIPMDLLVLESSDDDPVVKSSVKGVATVAGNVRPDSRLRAGSSASPAPGSLSHVNTGSSMGSTLTTNSSSKSMMVTTTVLDSPKDERIMYPFRVKHLGKEVYTLFAPSAQNRQDWCDKILEAKTKHAAALFVQNAEPFRLRVMADSAFAYENPSAGSQSVTISGTPLDRAIDDVEKLFSHTGRPGPICRARVNCATAFMQPYGKAMVAVGTDYGVYISETENPRGWSRSITIPKVTQIAVLEEFSMMLLISDKSLIAYHLDLVCPVGGAAGGNTDSSRRAPQKLSGSRDVGFFASGKMKDRTLVFYKKREGLSSTFKVLEPVFQKSTEKKSRFLRTGRTEFFRDYDEFYIPTECYGLNLFHSSLSISTSKGFEVLTLDKKQPWSVPDLKASHVATIASRLQGLDPLGMFRLSDQEFLLCYEECAVYVNKHGDVSRSVIMEFVGKAKAAALYGPYVLLFDPDFVEVRNAQNGRLRQVIPGRDVKCLDDGLGLGGHWVQPGGGNGGLGQNGTYGGNAAAAPAGVTGRTVKLAMQHPRHEKCQIVVELLLNEGQRD
ncbi:Rho guanine nucleotide exchange factor [Neofusicoccum ribis]|uniref:Rho guanine nucleotide exchange factor n=1 Tax=Neofusicoccum ribis TaxID=45134 RepID=A0ABR3SJN9_9PEZI